MQEPLDATAEKEIPDDDKKDESQASVCILRCLSSIPLKKTINCLRELYGSNVIMKKPFQSPSYLRILLSKEFFENILNVKTKRNKANGQTGSILYD